MIRGISSLQETIVALSSAPGRAAIGVIRLSGSTVRQVLRQVLKRSRCIESPRRMIRDSVVDGQNGAVDDVLSVFFPGPNSFTGQDMAEIHCHGGQVVTEVVLEIILRAGARAAQAGEFTRRAFENGKLDLSRAEAVLHLVDAQSADQARAAVRSLSGELSSEIRYLAEKTKEALAALEACIDFPDEELVEQLPTVSLELLAESASRAALRLRTEAEDDFEIVLCGRQNVGKSSLLNAMAGQQIALVTETAGTTRDPVRARLRLFGQAVELVDTAGLSEEEPVHLIDRLCQEKTRRKIIDAALVIWVCEPDNLQPPPDWCKETLLAINKVDLACTQKRRQLEKWQQEKHKLLVSAKTGEGLDALKNNIKTHLERLLGHSEGIPVSLRQKQALERATSAVRAAGNRCREKQFELAAEDLRETLVALGELSGEVIDPDVLDMIFSRFCIGK